MGSMYCDEMDDGIRQRFDRELVDKNPQSPFRGEPLCEHIDEYRKE